MDRPAPPAEVQETITVLAPQPTAAPGEFVVSGIGTSPEATMVAYLDAVTVDVARYWAKVVGQAGLPAPVARTVWPAAGQRLSSACLAGPTTDEAAFYCPADDTIVVSQALAQAIWSAAPAVPDPADPLRSGDFAVAYVVAHEFAHAVQAELGVFTAAGSAFPIYKIELHADCWAGVWASSAYSRGLLDDADIARGIATAYAVGDLDLAAPDHHGTPEQRAGAFRTGYLGASPAACDDYLFANY